MQSTFVTITAKNAEKLNLTADWHTPLFDRRAEIHLVGYTISGVLSVAGIPSTPVAYLKTNSLKSDTPQWANPKDPHEAVPLLLSGPHTAVYLPNPMPVVKQHGTINHSFELVDVAGDPLTFTDAALIFRVDIITSGFVRI